MRCSDAEGALGVCRRRGPVCPRLWLDVLWWPPPAACLPELLHVIGEWEEWKRWRAQVASHVRCSDAECWASAIVEARCVHAYIHRRGRTMMATACLMKLLHVIGRWKRWYSGGVAHEMLRRRERTGRLPSTRAGMPTRPLMAAARRLPAEVDTRHRWVK